MVSHLKSRLAIAVTTTAFGFVGLDDHELELLSVLLTKVRQAAGDFA